MNFHPLSYQQLIALGEGRLVVSPEAAAHLINCVDCSMTLTRLQAVQSVLDQGSMEVPPAATLMRAHAIFARDSRRSKQSTPTSPISLTRLSLLPAAMALLLAVFLFLGGYKSLAPAVQNTLPGDTFYPVKITFESLELATVSQEGKVQVELEIAETRVREIHLLMAQQRYSEIPQITRDFAQKVQAATNTLDAIVQKDPTKNIVLAEKAASDLAGYSNSLATLTDASPAAAKLPLAQAAAISYDAQAKVQAQINVAGVVPAAAPVPTRGAGAPNPVVPSATPVPAIVPTRTPSIPAKSVPTLFPSAIPTQTPVAQPTVTAISPSTAPSAALTLVPIASPTPTNTPFVGALTPINTVLAPSAAPSNTPLLSPTPLALPTPSPSATATASPTASATSTSSPTATPTLTNTATVTFTPTNTWTPTSTATPTFTLTPTSTLMFPLPTSTIALTPALPLVPLNPGFISAPTASPTLERSLGDGLDQLRKPTYPSR